MRHGWREEGGLKSHHRRQRQKPLREGELLGVQAGEGERRRRRKRREKRKEKERRSGWELSTWQAPIGGFQIS